MANMAVCEQVWLVPGCGSACFGRHLLLFLSLFAGCFISIKNTYRQPIISACQILCWAGVFRAKIHSDCCCCQFEVGVNVDVLTCIMSIYEDDEFFFMRTVFVTYLVMIRGAMGVLNIVSCFGLVSCFCCYY